MWAHFAPKQQDQGFYPTFQLKYLVVLKCLYTPRDLNKKAWDKNNTIILIKNLLRIIQIETELNYLCAMEQNQDKLKEIISHSKEYGFIFPSSDIYDGLAATYDYGQLGSELKNNIKQYWWKAMTQMHQNIVGIDASIFMHPKTWKASGHVDAFNDPLIDNKDSNFPSLHH